MSDYLTEQEQIEVLKSWIKQYSGVVILGLALAVALVFGWRYWQQQKYKTLSAASIIYDDMLTARAQNKVKETDEAAQKLLSQHAKTIYATMAALQKARTALMNKRPQQAEEYFNWVINNSKVPSLKQTARIRLARLYISQKRYQESLTLLQTVDDTAFSGLIAEVKGDAYFAMNQLANARAAYKIALAELPNVELTRPLLQIKYDNLQ